jgi:uncharacterized protein
MNLHKLLPLALFFCTSVSPAKTQSSNQDVSLETRTGVLSGSLLVPPQQTSNAPVVLIIAGSGPTDRDGNSPAGVQASTYKLIAEGLAARGIASLRYDKLFSGSSRPKIIGEQDLRFEDYASDAAAWLGYLEKDARFKRVYVLGHSEGSLVGILAAQQKTVTGLISLSGAGRNIADILLDQLHPKLTPDLWPECQRIINELRAGRRVAAAEAQLPAEVRDALFRDSVQPYLISWMKYDPSQEISKLKAKVLVMHGSADLQVPLLDAQRLAAGAGVKPVVLQEANHVFKTAPPQAEANIATYGDPNLPLAPGVIEALTTFISGSRLSLPLIQNSN